MKRQDFRFGSSRYSDQHCHLQQSRAIDFSMNFKITGSGQVEWAGGQSKGYPSYAAYSYTRDNDGNIVTNEIKTRKENKIEDLTGPMTEIQ